MLGVALIQVPAWHTVSLVEAIWLASGLIALILPMFHLFPLYDDWRVAKLMGKPTLAAVARGYLRREVVRVLQGTCLSIIGVYAALQPSPLPNGKDYVSVVGLILTGVLISLSMLIWLQSHWDWRTRAELQHLVEEANGITAKEKA